MAKLIKCPWHDDGTPSLALYSDGYYCHGCAKKGPLAELGLVSLPEMQEPEPEDIEQELAQADSLPIGVVRGLLLPYNSDGFYIIWPDRTYYKFRYWTGKPKYRNPVGHKQGLLWAARPEGAKTCLIVEGELNALSLAVVAPSVAIVSPGSASNFKAQAKNLLQAMISYDRIIIVADQDSAGAIACIELMGQFAGKVKKVKAHLMPKDANDLLQAGTLREEVQKIMGEGPR